MNTTMNYLYRDASNYKVWNTVVLSGQITEEQKKQIFDCLAEGDNFIPSQVGLPEKRFETINEDDGPYFELDTSYAFEETEDEPTVDMSVDELVDAFRQCKGKWNEAWPWSERGSDDADELSEEKRQQIFEEVLAERKAALIQGILFRWCVSAELNPRSAKCLRKFHQRLKIANPIHPDEFFKRTTGFSTLELSQAFANLKLENELQIPEEKIEWLMSKTLFSESAEDADVVSYTREEFAKRANALMEQPFLQ